MPPLLRTLIFTVLVPGTVTIYVPYRLLRGHAQVAWPSWHALGLPVLLFGAGVYAWCAFDFSRKGRGTPGPWDPPRKLVVRGLYRYVRNPMYIGVCSVLLGEAILFGSWPVLRWMLIFWPATFLFIVLYEEPALRAKFGDEYVEYCRRVPRWIPKFSGTTDEHG